MNAEVSTSNSSQRPVAHGWSKYFHICAYFTPYCGSSYYTHLPFYVLFSKNYKAWRIPEAPRNPHSPFGDFPKEYLPKQKLNSNTHSPIFEDSQAATIVSK